MRSLMVRTITGAGLLSPLFIIFIMFVFLTPNIFLFEYSLESILAYISIVNSIALMLILLSSNIAKNIFGNIHESKEATKMLESELTNICREMKSLDKISPKLYSGVFQSLIQSGKFVTVNPAYQYQIQQLYGRIEQLDNLSDKEKACLVIDIKCQIERLQKDIKGW